MKRIVVPVLIAGAIAAGCDDFLQKPFKLEDLLMLIEKYIGK